MRHRGRFQAQGVRLEESEPWASATEIGVSEGLLLIDNLEVKLPRREREIREASFRQAREYVHNAGNVNGVFAQISKTYRVKNTKSERVDIEVRAGRAFVKDSEVFK
ncbi:TPA: hypothetical protein ACMDVV_004636 [Vibrio parahaemolyticus]|nr:hypothetical protein [Vibrio parahaemolyticus]